MSRKESLFKLLKGLLKTQVLGVFGVVNAIVVPFRAPSEADL